MDIICVDAREYLLYTDNNVTPHTSDIYAANGSSTNFNLLHTQKKY